MRLTGRLLIAGAVTLPLLTSGGRSGEAVGAALARDTITTIRVVIGKSTKVFDNGPDLAEVLNRQTGITTSSRVPCNATSFIITVRAHNAVPLPSHYKGSGLPRQ
ncbi:MAG TPA: hypothetical protein VNL71_25445 [Chloroflexota bacterium]|nr:hypothetical protein [Chloroflexota bacterium]